MTHTLAIESIPIHSLNVEDSLFRISFGRPIDALAAGLAATGQCLQPIIVWSGGASSAATSSPAAPRLVHGFRRVEAARRLGWTALPAIALPAAWPERDVFLAGLHLFLSTDTPNPVETALIIRRLERYFDRAEIIERFLPLLGLQPAAALYQRARAVWDLPEAARRGLASGALDPACAHALELFPPVERAAAAVLILALRPSRSLQRELLETLNDLCRRDGVTIEQIMNAFGSGNFGLEQRQKSKIENIENESLLSINEPITNDKEQMTTDHEQITPNPQSLSINDLPQLREAFRGWLRARRFPILTAQEQRFEAARDALALPPGVTLAPPPHFEGARHELRLGFSSPAEFDRLLDALTRLTSQTDELNNLWQ